MNQNPQSSPPANPLSSNQPWEIVADHYAVDLLSWAQYFAGEALKLAALAPSSRVLDVATGPGTLALMAAEQGHIVSAIDFSPQMIANFKRRAAELAVDVADVRVGDGMDLPYEDDQFDAAFSMVGLIFFPDRSAGFREMRRVLRPGGRAVVSSIASIEGPFPGIMSVVARHVPQLDTASPVQALGTVETFTEEMSTAGFRQVEIHSRQSEKSWPTTAAYWTDSQRASAPVALMREKLGQETWSAISADVAAHLRETYGDNPVEERYSLLLGAGVK